MDDSFRIYVKHLGGLQDLGGFRLGLESLFDEVCTSDKTSFLSSSVLFTTSGIQSHELLIYLLPSKAQSRIKKVSPGQNLGSGNGNTMMDSGNGNISELYMDSMKDWDMQTTVNLAFHELMHNKLRRSNDELHLESGFGLASADITGRTLNQRNIDDMAEALEKPVRQRLV